jgi:hypothetical protein
MGNRRMGLKRIEALMESLKRQLNLDGSQLLFDSNEVSGGLPLMNFGLHPQWNTNFGSETVEGTDPATSSVNSLTSNKVALLLSKVLAPIATQGAVPTAAQATQCFGGTGVVGTDTTIAAVATPTVTQRISRLTGNITGTITMTAGDDMVAQNSETLILFTENSFVGGSGVLKLTLNGSNSLLRASSEAWVSSAAGSDVLTKEANTDFTDGHNTIVITDDGNNSTILAGSFIYLHTGAADNSVACKAVIRTSGGVVTIESAS